ncbi:kinase-like domain-containing protein [Suillus spraguei]|nr:kinase-like domain-containing protein [Suillus spraguei]
MVISPKPRPINSSKQGVESGDVGFVNIDPTLRSDKVMQFRLLYTLFKDSISSTHLCRKCDDFKLYSMRIINKERVRIRSPHDHIQLQIEICREIRELRSSFLSPFIWIYEDGLEIHSIAEFYPNGSLQDLLDRDRSLNESHALHIACEIVEALDILHTSGIIHRDLAPCNVMFDVSGHAVITGFGQACRPDSAASFPLPDTGLYCAPELILGWAHDFSIDCWSFGLLMYMMLFGSVSLPHQYLPFIHAF